jgi:hypothetical protein
MISKTKNRIRRSVDPCLLLCLSHTSMTLQENDLLGPESEDADGNDE